MAGYGGARTRVSRSSEIFADRTLAPLLEASSHPRRCSGSNRGRTPLSTISRSWPYPNRLDGRVRARFPFQWSRVCGTRSSGTYTSARCDGGAGGVRSCNLLQKCGLRVSGRIRVAYGSISFVRTRSVPMVSSLAAAISEVGLNTADHHLDGQHFSHLRQLALANTWASLGTPSWLGNASRIRMLGYRGGGDCSASANAANETRYSNKLAQSG
jgi:hypothetical protein